jgi:hypothetical protein
VVRGHPWWLQTSYDTQDAFGLPVRANIGLGWGRRPIATLPGSAAPTGRLVAIPQLSGLPTFAGVAITVPSQATACFSQVAVGWFRAGPRPTA